jgi:hypothetical protein
VLKKIAITFHVESLYLGMAAICTFGIYLFPFNKCFFWLKLCIMERCQLDGEVCQSFSLVYNLMEIVILAIGGASSAPDLRITFVEFI